MALGESLKKRKTLWPLFWMGFNCLKARATSKRQFTFYQQVPRKFWYSFYWTQKDEKLSQPWSHPMVLNMGQLDWESSNLTTNPLLLKAIGNLYKNIQLMLEFFKALFLVLQFSYYILMIFLMMLSVILLSMLMILSSALNVIKHLICGNK